MEEGRGGGGVHRTSHRGCTFAARLTVHTYIKVNVATRKYAYEQIFIYTHITHGKANTHTHTHSCFNRQIILQHSKLNFNSKEVIKVCLVKYSKLYLFL